METDYRTWLGRILEDLEERRERLMDLDRKKEQELYRQHPEIVERLLAKLEQVRKAGRSRPVAP